MNTSPSPVPPGADELASLWAARLDGGELDAAGRRELEAWLGQAPEHRELLSRYCQLSTDLERTLAPAISRSGLSDRPVVSRRRWLVATVAVAAAITLLLVLRRPAPASLQSVATVSAPQMVTLSEGTRVELNAHTRFAFRNAGSERRVQMLEGEAFFSVSHDASRPFFVETSAGTVRVTGTKFSVRSESAAELEVIVAEGSVEMSTPGNAGKIMLGAGNRGFARDGQTRKEELTFDAVEDALAWREGKIVLNGLTLQEALQRFGRYHDRRIDISPAAAGKHPAGSLNLGDLEGLLVTLNDPLNSLGVRATATRQLIRVRLDTEP
jgi:transmembrane sensor